MSTESSCCLCALCWATPSLCTSSRARARGPLPELLLLVVMPCSGAPAAAAAAKTAVAPTGAACAADAAGVNTRHTASVTRHSWAGWLASDLVIPRCRRCSKNPEQVTDTQGGDGATSWGLLHALGPRVRRGWRWDRLRCSRPHRSRQHPSWRRRPWLRAGRGGLSSALLCARGRRFRGGVALGSPALLAAALIPRLSRTRGGALDVTT